ncbi:MAG: putative metal-binding motif-containing protein [Alphaproteobacteria bacterium]|nr:putative metal-binding motif-containing protein [Alphaproteobacteria bacterium]
MTKPLTSIFRLGPAGLVALTALVIPADSAALRCIPATLVTVPDDFPDLADAVTCADVGGRIEIDASSGWLPDSGDVISINRDVTIAGINGTPELPALEVAAGTSLTLEDVELTGDLDTTKDWIGGGQQPLATRLRADVATLSFNNVTMEGGDGAGIVAVNSDVTLTNLVATGFEDRAIYMVAAGMSARLLISLGEFTDNPGGALYVKETWDANGNAGSIDATLSGVAFADNVADEGADLYAYGVDALAIDACTFDSGTVLDRGGSLHLLEVGYANLITSSFVNTAASDGGAIYAELVSRLELDSLTFEGAAALGVGGAIYLQDTQTSGTNLSFIDGYAAQGAAIFAGAGQSSTSSALTLYGTVVDGALGYGGFPGGALAFVDVPATLSTTSIRNVEAESGSALYATGESVAITDLTLQGFSVSSGGGAIFLEHMSPRDRSSVVRAQVCDAVPTATDVGYGALLRADDAMVDLRNVAVQGVDGAGFSLIHLEESDLSMINNTFAENGVETMLLANNSTVEAVNNIVTGTPTIFETETPQDVVDGDYNLWWGFDEVAQGVGDMRLPGANDIDGEGPGFWSGFDPADCGTLPYLGGGSPAVDSGHPAILDPDYGPSDRGAFGGLDRVWTDLDQDGWPGGPDCDDLDAAVSPGAAEVWYDGVDQDCAGDDDFDADADSWTVDEDCDDADEATHPGAAEVWYDGVDQDCAGDNDFDADADGWDAQDHGGDDCDDGDPGVNPGAEELFGDAIDQDCDGSLGDIDLDGDSQASVAQGGSDCDDGDPTIYDGAPEIVGDGIDQDCDGADAAVKAGGGCASAPLSPTAALALLAAALLRRRRFREVDGIDASADQLAEEGRQAVG